MALNWSVKNVPNFEEVCYRIAPEDQPWNGAKAGDKVLTSLTYVLVMSTMMIDLGQWTSKNIDEVYRRLALWEKVFGPLRKGAYVTQAEVEAHIGLHCNVINTTAAAWNKKFIEAASREVTRK